MDGRDIFAEKFSENFNLSRNKVELENRILNHSKILEEFNDKGIIALFESRNNSNIFREDGLTSEESANLSKMAKQSYVLIQEAALYDLDNPIEAQKWLNSIAPYLNNYNINLEGYTHFGIPEINNPFNPIPKELEEKIYNEIIHIIE